MSIKIIFNENREAISLSDDQYMGPMLYASAPIDFDANNWTDYVLTESNEVIQRISISALQKSCQLRLDNFALTRGYDNILSACSYINSSNELYKLEASYAIQSRDDTWDALYDIINDVESGKRPPIKTFDEIVDELPVLEWPTLESGNTSNNVIVTTEESGNTSNSEIIV